MWTWISPQAAGGGDGKKHNSLSEHWELLATSSLTGPLVQLKVCPSYKQKLYYVVVIFHHQWGSNKNLLAANCGKEVQILTKHVMKAHYNQQVSTHSSDTHTLAECCMTASLQFSLFTHNCPLYACRYLLCKQLLQCCMLSVITLPSFTPSPLTYILRGPMSQR